MNGVVGGDNEGIGEGEEGQREFEEMLVFARMGGERCRTAISSFGSGWDTMPSGQVRAAKTQAQTKRSTSGAPSHGNGTSGTSNPGVAPTAIANGSAQPAGLPAITTGGANPAVVTTPINKGTIPYSLDGIFRTAMTAYHGVGETLTKALATRVSDILPHPQGLSKSAPAANRGIPHSMATGGSRMIGSDGPTKSSAIAS
jgi:hypothetical protein